MSPLPYITKAFLMQQGLPFCTTNFLCSQAYISHQRVTEIGNVLKMAPMLSLNSLHTNTMTSSGNEADASAGGEEAPATTVVTSDAS